MEFDRDTLISWLEEKDATRLERLYSGAYRTKVSTVGDKVYLRGLVEISNICRKNCLYCGIRRDNHAAGRYEISSEEVLQSAEFAYKEGYASLVIQGGERTDRAFIQTALAARYYSVAGRTASGSVPGMVRGRSSPVSAAHRELFQGTV